MKVHFRPRLIPTICTLILAPLLGSLGFWQLDRAKEKTEIQNRYLSRFSEPPIQITSSESSVEDIEFHMVTVTGSWDDTHQFLLDNRVLNGRAGYFVFAPVILQDGKTAVLVNRGWILASADRSKLPELQRIEGETTVTGTAVIPPEDVFQLKDQQPIGETWETVWQVLDIKRFNKTVPYATLNFIVQMNPDHPEGFERQWSLPNDEWILRHKGYAFQWFALCAALLVIYCLFTFRPSQGSNSEP